MNTSSPHPLTTRRHSTAPVQRGGEADFKHPAGFLKPVVNSNRCEGKGPCITVCPVDVFAMGTLPKEQRAGMTLVGTVKGYVHGWQQALVVNPDACRACGLCVVVCPEKAITLARNSAL